MRFLILARCRTVARRFLPFAMATSAMATFIVALSFVATGTGYAADPPVPSSATLKGVQFDGLETVSGSELRESFPYKAGDPWHSALVLEAAVWTRSALQRRGYLEATAVARATSTAEGWMITVDVRQGPLYRFGETRIQGLQALPDKVVWLRLPYKSGDAYVRSELFETQTELYTSGLFDRVSISVSTSPAHVADVLVALEERKFKWIKGGFGYGSEERWRGTLSLTHENLFHRAYRAELITEISTIWLEYRLEFLNPFIFNTKTEYRATASWRNEQRESYRLERLRGETSLGRKLKEKTRGSVALLWDRNIVFDVSPLAGADTPGRSDSRSVRFALNRDNSDDFFNPARGTRSNLSYQRAGGGLGGSLDFNRVIFETVGYKTLWGSLIGAGALRSGVIEEFGATPEVPVFERFFIGGANSIRGYDERDVGPKDVDDTPLGGKYKLGSTIELRFPLVWKLRGAVFLDGGQVAFKSSGVRPSLWKWGAGTGIRLLTPVGPFRLDYGYKLNRDIGDNDPWRIHFSLGESF